VPLKYCGGKSATANVFKFGVAYNFAKFFTISGGGSDFFIILLYLFVNSKDIYM
jgi:hypothetical protein